MDKTSDYQCFAIFSSPKTQKNLTKFTPSSAKTAHTPSNTKALLGRGCPVTLQASAAPASPQPHTTHFTLKSHL